MSFNETFYRLMEPSAPTPPTIPGNREAPFEYRSRREKRDLVNSFNNSYFIEVADRGGIRFAATRFAALGVASKGFDVHYEGRRDGVDVWVMRRPEHKRR